MNQKTGNVKKLRDQRDKIIDLFAEHYWEISDSEAEIVLEVIDKFNSGNSQ